MPVIRIAEVRVAIPMDYAYDLLYFIGKRGIAMPRDRPQSLPRPRDSRVTALFREFLALASSLVRLSSAPQGLTDGSRTLSEQVLAALNRVREIHGEVHLMLNRINELRNRIARLEMIEWLATTHVPETTVLRVYIALIDKASENRFVEAARRLGVSLQWLGDRGNYSAYLAVGDRVVVERLGATVFTLEDLREAARLRELRSELAKLESEVGKVVDRDVEFASYLKALVAAVEAVLQTYDRSAVPEGLEVESLVSKLREEISMLETRRSLTRAVIDVLEGIDSVSDIPRNARIVVEPEEVKGMYLELRLSGKRVVILVEGESRGGIELTRECLADVRRCLSNYRKVLSDIESLLDQRRRELERVLADYRSVSAFGDEEWSRRRDVVSFVFYVPENEVSKLDEALIEFIKLIGVDLRVVKDSKVVFLRPSPAAMPTLEAYPEPLNSFNKLVRMFSVPRPIEVPPVALAAILFPLFYGLMYGDAGHGIVLSVFGLLLIKRLFGGKYREWGIIFLASGFASIFTGLIIYGEMFGMHIGKPILPLFGHGLEVNPRSIPILLTVSMFIGFIVMLISFIIKLINEVRLGESLIAASIAPPILGLYIGLSTLIAGLVWVEPLNNVSIVSMPSIVIGLVWVPIGYALLRRYLAETGESPASILVSEIIEAALAGVANLISFARLLIIVLIHGVFTKLTLVFTDIFGVVGLPITIILQILVIVGEGFVTVVQAMRLMYYETFSKFFVGGGTPFTPLVIP